MIRPYQKADLQVIMDIGNRAWRGLYAALRRVYGDELFDLMKSDEKTEKGEEIKFHCENYPDWVFICEEECEIVGFVTFILYKEKKIGEILNNAVDPECKLKGMGQQMYKAVFDYFKKNGIVYAKVFTEMDEAHAPARRAYERAGFNIKGESVSYFKKL